MAAPDIPAGEAPASPRPLIMRYAARSDVGRIRAKNDDSAYVGRHLAVVADGMGGHAGGDVASAATVLDMIHLDHGRLRRRRRHRPRRRNPDRQLAAVRTRPHQSQAGRHGHHRDRPAAGRGQASLRPHWRFPCLPAARRRIRTDQRGPHVRPAPYRRGPATPRRGRNPSAQERPDARPRRRGCEPRTGPRHHRSTARGTLAALLRRPELRCRPRRGTHRPGNAGPPRMR